MAWDPDISTWLHSAFHSDDVAEFARILTEHPSYLRDEDGANFWMAKAAAQNKLPFVQTLFGLGVGVNEPNDMGDPDHPFYEPEGPIIQAASFGHAEIVRWLLDHGAKINYVVVGQPRCLPLIRAATEGHLDVVKLLVEHGADVHATWHGLNAIKQAEAFGRDDVRDYLLSLPGPEPR